MSGLFIHLPKITAYNGPPSDTVRGGGFVTCSNGHTSASVTRAYDPRKKEYYVEAKCHFAGCTAINRTYDKDRGTG